MSSIDWLIMVEGLCLGVVSFSFGFLVGWTVRDGKRA
jgi:hypothetical protein